MNRIKNIWKKSSVFISILLLVALIISTVKWNQEYKEDKRAYEHFLNRLYFNIHSTINGIDAFLEEQTQGVYALHQISLDLLETHKTLEDADLFLNMSINYYDELIVYGVWEVNSIINRDDIVSIEEKEYLRNLRDTLAGIQEDMYSEQTGQENPNLSIDELNKIIEPSDLRKLIEE